MARIVYIDDEEALREVTAEILATGGHETVLASSGRAGIEAVRREQPDLVLCDVNMPGLGGYGVLQAIREDPRLSSIPFLFLTSLDAPDHVRTAMISGADDYLTKPIGREALLAAVAARLARRKASQLEADARVNELRDSMAKLLPHELRTPLTTILGGSQFLAQCHREMSPEDIGQVAESMFRAAQRLHRMAESYILYSELELDRLAGRAVTRHDLLGSSGAEEVRRGAEEVAAEWRRGDDLRLELDDAKVPLAAAYLRKVAVELVDNAFKFSERGTTATVRLRADASGVTLEVADAGRGMTADQVRQIGAFRQFDRALFEQQGSGLGLALVRRIVVASGGDLALDSSPGPGTRVTSRWPL
ncbi:MAG: hybrid sensor histidine kinase/response regulator [Acidobacteria bacterium]|nr:MAG: hybrid sensor histidine kinase/response regulator [Acidobacteriota bacterium]